MGKFLMYLFILSLGISSCNNRLFHRNVSRKAEKKLFGNSLGKKKAVKIKEPRKVLKAKKEQEANQQRLKREYEKSVLRSKKRAIDIQTPEVQARMIQNQKDSDIRDAAKKKKVKANSKKAGKKYN